MTQETQKIKQEYLAKLETELAKIDSNIEAEVVKQYATRQQEAIEKGKLLDDALNRYIQAQTAEFNAMLDRKRGEVRAKKESIEEEIKASIRNSLTEANKDKKKELLKEIKLLKKELKIK